VTDGGSAISDREYEALADFRYALRKFLRFSEDAARASGLAPNQHQLLLVLRGWRGARPPSISDAAERLQLRHHSTVELVQRAASAGLVTVTTDPRDQRRQLLALTDTGDRKLTALSIMHRRELQGFRRQMADLVALLD
jgi:DNA-binding MarR family transcriptional regulator